MILIAVMFILLLFVIVLGLGLIRSCKSLLVIISISVMTTLYYVLVEYAITSSVFNIFERNKDHWVAMNKGRKI